MGVLPYGFSFDSKIARVFLVCFGVLLLIVLAAYGFIYYRSKQNTRSQDERLKYALGLKSDLEKDSDGDGRKNWEEELYGTNPNNPDSDGDSAPDGEEVVDVTAG